MTITRRSLLQAASVSPMLFLADCGSSGLITALDVAEIAATAAIPVITAFGSQLGPLEPTAIAYCQGIATACGQSVTELGSTDPQATQYTKIAGYFAAVAALSLPPGTVGEVLAVISAIVSAVQIILTDIHATPTPAPARSRTSSSDAAANDLLTKYRAQVKALGSDKARIADILARAASVKGH